MEVGGVVSLKLRGEEKLSIVEISNQILSVVKTDVLMSESFIHIHIHTHTFTYVHTLFFSLRTSSGDVLSPLALGRGAG